MECIQIYWWLLGGAFGNCLHTSGQYLPMKRIKGDTNTQYLLVILPEGTSRLISFDHPVKDLSLLGMKLGDRRTEMMVD